VSLCEVDKAYKRYGAVAALDGLSLAIDQGEIVGIVGPNGSGKTTLFNCVSGQTRLTAGTVRWKGEDITRRTMSRIARLGIVRTFQESMYFASGTSAENVATAVALARTAQRRRPGTPAHAVVAELIDLTRLGDATNRAASALSHGQLRSLGLAMALAARPEMLMLDEPAAGLSATERQTLAAILRSLHSRGITLAVVDHDMGFLAPIIDRMIVLSAGRVLAEGEPTKVMAKDEVLDSYLGAGYAAAARTAE
jgi:ABC-type branched-subunit amino acid transport system ATPase component